MHDRACAKREPRQDGRANRLKRAPASALRRDNRVLHRAMGIKRDDVARSDSQCDVGIAGFFAEWKIFGACTEIMPTLGSHARSDAVALMRVAVQDCDPPDAAFHHALPQKPVL